ncbi:hypothetical protein HXX76_009320 [Chlamydomonas incerta]|uniref:Uncharacterized protein n=1 Tax=Chlamydomonas incerta TaxID=51695 RepID=A0A835T588_CHLIN|nr:hypothetical protein HXX76_009320 [Chlamydomonas incerta]|eukprot:KAG2431826.1 hypothetical protein HXX76_009320 [Chlamydomonas incerta]
MFRRECDFNRLVLCESKEDAGEDAAVEVPDKDGGSPWCWKCERTVEGGGGLCHSRTDVWYIEELQDEAMGVPPEAMDVARSWLSVQKKAGWHKEEGK